MHDYLEHYQDYEKIMKQQPKNFDKISETEKKNLKVEVGDNQYTVKNSYTGQHTQRC